MEPAKVKATDQIWKDFKKFYTAEYDEVPSVKELKDYASDVYYEFIGYLRNLKREEEYEKEKAAWKARQAKKGE